MPSGRDSFRRNRVAPFLNYTTYAKYGFQGLPAIAYISDLRPDLRMIAVDHTGLKISNN